MGVTRSLTYAKGGHSPITIHGFIDTGAGGKIVLSAEAVKKTTPPTIPTKAGLVEAARYKWLIISIVNNGADLTWTTIPDIRGSNIFDVDNPGYTHGDDIPSEAIKGAFRATIKAGKEQFVQIDTSLTGWGVTVRAEAPAEALDLSVYILAKQRKGER